MSKIRIEAFTLYDYDEQQWKPWGTGASERIIERPPVKTTGIRMVFNDYREYPTLNDLIIN